MAAGQYTDTHFGEHALVETLAGSGWSATTGVDPAGGSSPVLTGVSCPTSGDCGAVGNAATRDRRAGAIRVDGGGAGGHLVAGVGTWLGDVGEALHHHGDGAIL